MKISRIKNIFVGMITTLAVAAGALNGCRQAANPAESAPIASSEALQEAASDTTSREQTIGKPTADESTDIGGEKITIRIASWYQESYLTNLKNYLSEEFPEYSFHFLYLEKNNYEALMDDQLACKAAPDIVCIDPPMARKHAKSGNIMNVSDITAAFSEEGKEAFTYDGKVYAVPNTCNYECFFYNKKLFEEEWKKEPADYMEYIELCDYFRLEKNMKPLAAGFKDERLLANSAIIFPNAGYFTTIYGKTFGDRLQFGKASFYKELYADLSLWEVLLEHEILVPEMFLLDKRAAIEEFATGKAAMMVGEPADYAQVMEANPEMEVGIFAIMDKRNKESAMIGGNECGFAVNSYGKHVEEAKAVVASLATTEGQEALWRDRVGSQTYLANVKFSNPDSFDPIRDILEENRLVAPYYSWGPHSRELYQTFGRELQQVVLDKKDLATALQDMDQEAQLIREEEW
jgi:ABC-type glycerol-3-phosphate transport system substrate-binding protein